MAFDVETDRICDIIPAFVEHFKAQHMSIYDFARQQGITFNQACMIIHMSTYLRSKES